MAKGGKSAQLVPLGDKVLIKPLDAKGEQKTASGIILPGKEGSEKQEKGEVLATGPGRFGDDNERIPMSVKKGDTVLYKRGYSAEEIDWEGEEYVLVAESDVLALVQ